MSENKPKTAVERIDALVKAAKTARDVEIVEAMEGKPKIEKLKKGGETNSDGRKKNGGARPGSGRKPTPASDLRRSYMQIVRDHAGKTVYVNETDPKTGKTKKKPITNLEVALEVLVSEMRNKQGWAVKEYLDRVLGRAVQPISNDEESPIMLNIDF